MTEHGLEPGFVKVRYDDTHRRHFATLQVKPSGSVAVGVEPTFVTKSGGTVSMSAAIAAWVAVFKLNFAAATSIVSADFWSKPTAGDDPIWVFTVDVGVAGTGGGTETFTRQLNRTFRTLGGHILKNVAEGISSAIPNDFIGPIPNDDAVAVYLLSGASWILGRDDAFPAASLNYMTKTNDALRKKELGL